MELNNGVANTKLIPGTLHARLRAGVMGVMTAMTAWTKGLLNDYVRLP